MALSRSKLWGIVLGGVFIAYTAVTLYYLQPGPGTPHELGLAPLPMRAVADITQFGLMILSAGLTIWQALRSRGRSRVFWILMATGFATWAFSQAAWIYFEIFLRSPLPDPFWGDVVLFFHFVPFMAALVVRPHRPGEVRKIVLPAIDWSMLLVWWLFLYVYLVFPWQFIRLDVTKYDSSFNDLYLSENILWLLLLVVSYFTTRNNWKKIYGLLLAGGGLYLISSQLVNLAINRGSYYSGSVYDLPLVAAMLLLVWVVANAAQFVPNEDRIATPDTHEAEALGPRLAMVALLSIPLIVLWMDMNTTLHGDIYSFRLTASMITMVAMGLLVFAKQYLLDRERIDLLYESRRNFADLQRLQAQLVQNEKLASLSQIISGAAHEINNPLTAILGYSELMEYDARADENLKSHAAKIKQQVLRTKDLVRDLQLFARQPSGEKKLLDFNKLVEDSLRARESNQSNKSVRFVRELQPKLPPVLGNEKQLMEVCMQLLGNATDILSRSGGGEVKAKTSEDHGWIVFEVSDSGPGMRDPARVFDPFFTTKSVGQGTGLGLSICYGIISDHKGNIFAENRPEGGARFVVRLPSGGPLQSISSREGTSARQ